MPKELKIWLYEAAKFAGVVLLVSLVMNRLWGLNADAAYVGGICIALIWRVNRKIPGQQEDPLLAADLRGPNSSLTTITVQPKWKIIEEKFLRPCEGWKKLPDKLRMAYTCRLFEDRVSGMTFCQAEYEYGGMNNQIAEVIHDVQDVQFYMSTNASESGPLSLSSLSSDNPFEGLYGELEWDGDLAIGFDSDRRGPEEALGTLRLSGVLHQLRKMEGVLVGASLHKPINTDYLGATDTLKYNPNRNPTAKAFHIFENEFLTVAVQYRSFRGAFTKIEDYSDDTAKLLTGKYYEKMELPKDVVAVQMAIRKLYYDAPGTGVTWYSKYNKKAEEGRAAIQKFIEEWPNQYADMKRQLKRLETSISGLKWNASYLAQHLHLPKFLFELYETVSVYGSEEETVGEYRIARKRKLQDKLGPESEIILQHPSGNISIKVFKREFRSGHTKKGDSERKMLVEIDGGIVFSINFNMEEQHGVSEAPVGHSRHEWPTELGEILECAEGKWPFLLLQALFDIRAHLALREMSAYSAKASVKSPQTSN